MGTIKRNERRAEKVMENIEKLEPILIPADNVKWCSAAENVTIFSIYYIQKYHMIQKFYLLLDVYLKEIKAGYKQVSVIPMFTVYYPQQPKGGSNTVSTNT